MSNVVGTDQGTYRTIVSNMSPIVRKDKFEDKECIVCPVIMMVEGVHNGNNGPLYYSKNELSKFPDSWNHKPVVIRHPISESGESHSACVPNINTKVGTLFNTTFEQNKLKAEAWIEIEKIAKVAPEIYTNLLNGEVLEVSTGLFSEAIEKEGTWNGEGYSHEVVGIRPDHLAILPDETGACSIRDGAGIPRLNNDPVLSLNVKLFSANEQSHGDIVKNLRQALGEIYLKNTNGYPEFWIEDVFSDYFVYSLVYALQNGDIVVKYYKRMYEIDGETNVKVEDNRTEVQAKVEYLDVENKEENNKRKEIRMSDEREEGRKDKLEAQIDALGKKVDAFLSENNDNERVGEEEEMTINTVEDFIATAPEHLKVPLGEIVNAHKEDRDNIINNIVELSKEFTKEELEEMKMNHLRKIQKTLLNTKNAENQEQGGGNNFSANAGAVDSISKVEPLVFTNLD